MEGLKDIFQWNWYNPYISTVFGINYNTAYVLDDEGQPNGDIITMLEIGLIVGGLTIFLNYIPAE